MKTGNSFILHIRFEKNFKSFFVKKVKRWFITALKKISLEKKYKDDRQIFISEIHSILRQNLHSIEERKTFQITYKEKNTNDQNCKIRILNNCLYKTDDFILVTFINANRPISYYLRTYKIEIREKSLKKTPLFRTLRTKRRKLSI